MRGLERIPDRKYQKQYDFSYIQATMETFLSLHPKMRWKNLADRAGLDPSTVSKYKHGQIKTIQKNTAIRLALAMELDWEQTKRFVNAAGYHFPHDGLDYAIEEIFMKYQGKSIPYQEILYQMEPAPEFDDFLDDWFG